ncbi:uncharacterized protein KRP23_10854 [Phytophthora ramorum]|uniref:uncharacterized protein n=1 Tax=Phytophthora ramorum TaxID=164328 RepID=UPI0030A5F207|nr:hypothetical protein KRP23_10854 [Phytophthora ramorum]
MRTRASDAKLQKNEEAENALGEVMQQLDAEDKEGEPSDSGDSDYEDEGAGAARPAKTSKGIVLRGNADEDSVESEGVDDSDEDAETEAGSSSGKDAEEMEVSSSNEESASGVAQKRNRKGHRKSPRKAARTATTLSPRDGSDAEDGAFVEGFPCRWPSWEDFHPKTTGEDAAVVETRKGTQYIPESWVKYCKTLRCTHGRTQAARGSGKRKHRLVRATECTAKINARVVSGHSGWFITLKASGYHNHPVTKHQWFNYAENRVHAPQNNIDEGDVGVGGFYKSSCAAIRKDIVVVSTDKYIKTKELAEKIVDRMALQSTPTFRVALEWMQGFYDALQGGDVPRFVMEATTSNVLTVLSQESSMSSTGLTQISYVNPSLATSITPPAQRGDDTLEEKRTTSVQDASGEVHDVPEDEGLEASDPPGDVDVEAKLSSTSASRDTGSTPDGTELTQEHPKKDQKLHQFHSRPLRVLEDSRRIRDDKKTRKARLDDVAALLDGAYSLDIAKAMVDTLNLDDVEVQGSLSVRPYNVGQQVPKITRILQLDKIQEAITAIKATDNLNLLANWSDYGSATFDQLEAMASVLEARNRFQLVQFTLDWISGVEWQIKDVVPPFTDACDYTKQAYKEAVQGMRLG